MRRGTGTLEKRLLQITVAIGSLIPIAAGATGILLGPRMMGGHGAGPVDLDSQFRYLSGLLLAIGLGYASAIARIELKRRRFQLLTLVVAIGGVGRLISFIAMGTPSPVSVAALAMEVLVTPGLALWQHHVAVGNAKPRAGATQPVDLHTIQTW